VVICRSCQLATALVLTRPLARGRRSRPPLTSPSPNAERSISAVVPARDEAAAVTEERGAAVLAGRALPPGWADNAWALHQGVRAARDDLVLFLDADTLPRPKLARALAAELGDLIL
jgi:hypothetical protein